MISLFAADPPEKPAGKLAEIREVRGHLSAYVPQYHYI